MCILLKTLNFSEMTYPFSWIVGQWHSLVLAGLVLASAFLMWRLSSIGSPLTIREGKIAPWGIVNIEMPWTSARAKEIVDAWEGRGLIETAKRQTRLDFLFLLIYPAALSLACMMLAGSGSGSLATAGVALSWLVLLCTPLDALENVMILRMFDGAIHSPIPFLTSLAASLKFLLLFSTLGYIIYAGLTKVL